MTRINVGIPPAKLHKKHLIAELHEIIRIPGLVEKRIRKGFGFNDIPKKFTLGAGHVKFFYDKGLYTYVRYLQLKHEAERRGIKVTDYHSLWQIYAEHPHLENDYKPTARDKFIITQRINLRISQFKNNNLGGSLNSQG